RAVLAIALERALVDGDRLLDRHEVLLEDPRELAEGPRDHLGLPPLELADPPAEEEEALLVGAELVVELVELALEALVVGLGRDRAGERVGGLLLVLDAIEPELVGLEAELPYLGGVVGAGGIEDEERR